MDRERPISTCIGRIGSGLLLALLLGGSPSWAEEDESCFYCGMYHRQFEHSWVELHYADSGPTGFCSLHCASIHMALNRHRPPERIFASDHHHKIPIDADAALWVIGGDLPGVMTTRAKWAFGARTDAEAFVARHGGVIADFDRALEAAFEDMYRDIRLIQDLRAERRSRRISPP